MLASFLCRLLIFLSFVWLSKAVNPLVDVGNTKYLGVALPSGISQWLGVRFAAPPTGELRFRRPADPPQNSTTQAADAVGKFIVNKLLLLIGKTYSTVQCA